MDLKWNVPIRLMAMRHACTLRLERECKQYQRIPMGIQGNTQGWAVALRQKLCWLVGMETIPKCCPKPRLARINSEWQKTYPLPSAEGSGWPGAEEREHSLPSLVTCWRSLCLFLYLLILTAWCLFSLQHM